MSREDVPIRLVEWNVAMSLQNKTHLLAAMSPTVAILPESACSERTWPALATIGATSVEWTGANPNKGLLAVTFGEWRLQIDESFDPGFQWVMPIHLTGPSAIRLLAVWEMNHRGNGHETARRLGACRASLEHYADFLSADSDLTLISGDFNKRFVPRCDRRRDYGRLRGLDHPQRSQPDDRGLDGPSARNDRRQSAHTAFDARRPAASGCSRRFIHIQ